MGNIIYTSTWGTIKDTTWKDLEVHQWQDFALILYELESELQTKGIKVDRGKVVEDVVTEMDVKGISIERLTKPLVLENETEMNVAIFLSEINFYEMIMYFLPWYDKINVTFQALCRVLDTSFRYLEEKLDMVNRNLDLDRAIEMLSYFERLLKIESNDRISYEQRRRQVQVVANMMHRQITEKAVKTIVSAFSSNNASESEIIKTAVRDVIEIKFTKGGLPNNIDMLTKILEKELPAHLDWKYTYTQNAWDRIIKYKWGDVTDRTWAQLNEYKEVI